MEDILSKADAGVLLRTILAKPIKPMLGEKGTVAFQTPSYGPGVVGVLH
jgi:hypothetical protein